MCRQVAKSAGVVGSDAAFVVAKDHVHDPVQGVLGGPMGSDHRADRSGAHHQRGDVEARLVGDLAVDFAPAFDHNNGVQARLRQTQKASCLLGDIAEIDETAALTSSRSPCSAEAASVQCPTAPRPDSPRRGGKSSACERWTTKAVCNSAWPDYCQWRSEPPPVLPPICATGSRLLRAEPAFTAEGLRAEPLECVRRPVQIDPSTLPSITVVFSL